MTIKLSSVWDLIQRGEISALKILFTETNKSLINYAFRVTRDKQLAEEVVQDVFVNLWNNRTKIELSGSLRSYLYQSVHNTSVNKLIQQNTRRNSLNVIVSEEAWQYLEENFKIDDPIIEKLEAEETEKQILEIIEQLPGQCREIFKLSRFEMLSNQEISERLNLSVSTIKTQIYRAIEKIRNETGI